MVDLGGSLAVASKGLYATGVSTDLNGKITKIRTLLATYEDKVTYLSSGGSIGDKISAVRCTPPIPRSLTI
jgi:acyl-coenzyme A thioesterase 13